MRITLLVMSLLFWGCNSQSVEDEISLSIGNDVEIDLSKYVDSVSIINIEQKDDYYISDYMSNIVIVDSAIYFVDKRQDILYKYSVNGSAISRFERKGRTKNEYINITDFAFVHDKLLVLCFPYKMFILDENLNVENVLKLDCNYQNIESIGFEVLLYDHYSRETHNFDRTNLKTISRMTDYRKKYNITYRPQPVFSKLSDSTLMISMCGSDILYEINNSKIEIAFKLNYKNKEENYEKMNDISPDNVFDQMKYAQPTILNIIKTDRYLYIHYSYKARFRMVVLDNHKKTVVEDGIIVNEINSSSHLNKIGDRFCSIIDFEGKSIVNNIEKHNVSEQQQNKDKNLSLCIYNMK